MCLNKLFLIPVAVYLAKIQLSSNEALVDQNKTPNNISSDRIP